MKRLHFLVEGPTEKEFVESLLLNHLCALDKVCDVRLITTSRDWSSGKFYKGGIVSYGKLKHEIVEAIKEDNSVESFFTTIVDLYGLPTSFPGMKSPNWDNPKAFATQIESDFLADIQHELPSLNIQRSFIPNIVCHEFETLILTDASKLGNLYIGYQNGIQRLANQVAQVGDPELVNSGRTTAPSKRILSCIPEYDKVAAGALTALEIGLPTIRRRCARFDAWMTRLEVL